MEHKKWYHLTDSKNTTTWIAMVLIALVATMGSTMENTWYNTYVYNNVTPNTQAVAWMVSVSAVTAALGAIVFGAVSDRSHSRWGRRNRSSHDCVFVCGQNSIHGNSRAVYRCDRQFDDVWVRSGI